MIWTRSKVQVCWLDLLFNSLTGIGVLLPAVMYGALSYVAAALPLFVAGQSRYALDLPLILGAVGIAWVLFSYRQVTLRYEASLERVREVLDEPSYEEFDTLRRELLRRMRDPSAMWRWGLVVWLALILASLPAWFGWLDRVRFRWIYILPSEWYLASGLGWRVASVFIMAIPIVVMVWSTGRLFVLHIRFVRDLRHLRFFYSPGTYLSRVRPLLRLGVVASLTWSLGIGLFVLLLGRLDTAQHFVLSALGGIGAVGFVIPLLTLRAKLTELQSERRDVITRLILDSMRKPPDTRSELLELISLEEQLEANNRLGSLLVEWRYVAFVCITFVIPVFVNMLAGKLAHQIGW
jgi:hypothetical protein